MKLTVALMGYLLSFQLLQGCNDRHASSNARSAPVKDSVQQMMRSVAADISSRGPIAWLNYFEQVPSFFMASDGKIAFKDYPTAKVFIRDTLIKTMPTISLQWQGVQVDSLTPKLAAVGASFMEVIHDADTKSLTIKGYFSALAEFSADGWKFRNMHWSIK